MICALLLPVLAHGAEPPEAWFRGSVLAHRKLSAGSATVRVVQNLGGVRSQTDYDLAYVRPSSVKLRVREPEQGGRAATDRTFALVDGRLFAYDASVHEQLVRQAIPVGTTLQKLGILMGQVDDSVASLIDPDRLEAFYQPFRSLKGWNQKRAGALTVLTLYGPSKTRPTSVLKFETTTRLLRELRIDVPGGQLEWTMRYGPIPSKIGWRPPADAAKVASFTMRPQPPQYASAAARQIAERSIRAYDRLRHVHFWTEGPQGIQKVWISEGRAREQSLDFTYVLAGGQGFLRDGKGRRFFAGKAGVSTMLEALAKVGTRMDPIVKQILTRQNPVRMLLLPGIRVSLVGNMTIGGVASDILEFKTGTSKVALVVRRDNGLLASLRSTIRDANGNLVSESEKTLLYGPIGKALDPTLFKLSAPPGYRKLPLSELIR